MTINYRAAVRAAFAEKKAINYNTFKTYCAGDNCDDKVTRAAFKTYRDRAAVLVSVIADEQASITNGAPIDAARVIDAAKNYLCVFAETSKDNAALLFNVDTAETNDAAAMRIISALAPIAKNGTAKQFDGARRGAINLNADGKATATIMQALETWALDRINGARANNAAMLILDKKQRKAAAAAKRNAQKAAAEKAKAETTAAPATVPAVDNTAA